jgi:hypothetical protein
MTNIIERKNNSKFIVYDDSYLSESNCKYTVLLSHLKFWVKNIDELQVWLQAHDCTKQGMTVNIPDDERMVLFALRWS